MTNEKKIKLLNIVKNNLKSLQYVFAKTLEEKRYIYKFIVYDDLNIMEYYTNRLINQELKVVNKLYRLEKIKLLKNEY